jgi:hypothetical protein
VRLLNPIWLIAKKGKKVAGMDYYYLLGEEEAAKVRRLHFTLLPFSSQGLTHLPSSMQIQINPLVESLMLEQSSKRLQEEGMQEQ